MKFSATYVSIALLSASVQSVPMANDDLCDDATSPAVEGIDDATSAVAGDWYECTAAVVSDVESDADSLVDQATSYFGSVAEPVISYSVGSVPESVVSATETDEPSIWGDVTFNFATSTAFAGAWATATFIVGYWTTFGSVQDRTSAYTGPVTEPVVSGAERLASQDTSFFFFIVSTPEAPPVLSAVKSLVSKVTYKDDSTISEATSVVVSTLSDGSVSTLAASSKSTLSTATSTKSHSKSSSSASHVSSSSTSTSSGAANANVADNSAPMLMGGALPMGAILLL
ncbi:unnamed protein product [Ambrosiozyma monospora]|uniref:Unnamed protein product n=1 Tax=Ambrosiozyma monospora TaxID=43982 RepID=A0A9W6YRU7_AMBMO|nr:unnamed protein product [Ambrosiozyma monospora]